MTTQTIDIPDLIKRLKIFAEERDWEQFHAPKNLVMALSVEASELLEHFQWLTNEASENLSDEAKQEVAYEVADVFIYLMRLVERLDIDLATVVEDKIKINAKKYPVAKAKGKADKYTVYEE